LKRETWCERRMEEMEGEKTRTIGIRGPPYYVILFSFLSHGGSGGISGWTLWGTFSLTGSQVQRQEDPQFQQWKGRTWVPAAAQPDAWVKLLVWAIIIWDHECTYCMLASWSSARSNR
jgi:hypothetical protein